MLQNAYFLAKIGADTAENEQHFAEILPIGRRVADRCPGARRVRSSASRKKRARWQAASWIGDQSQGISTTRTYWENWEIGKISKKNLQNFANFWRARSRLYQNEILQENMRLTAFFKLYKICILLHRCNLKILAKNRFEKSAIFVKIQQKFCKSLCCVARFCKILPKFLISKISAR